MSVLHPAGRVRPLVDRVGFLKALLDAPDLAVDVDVDVRFGSRFAPVATVVQNRSPNIHRMFGIEDGGKNFVVDLDLPGSLFGGGFGLGDDSGDALPGET